MGAFNVNAQDLIVLKDGNIEAKVMEISQSEIRYKRPDNLELQMLNKTEKRERFRNNVVTVKFTALHSTIQPKNAMLTACLTVFGEL